MKGKIVDDYRTIQFFLTDAGVYEVSATKNHKDFKCTCSGYVARKKCTHIKFVRDRIQDNYGNYPTQISSKATKEEAEKASLSNEDFRYFLIKYGKIEVI